MPLAANAAPSISLIPMTSSSDTEFIPEEVVVGLKPNSKNFESSVKSHGGKIVDQIKPLNAFLIQVPQNKENSFVEAISKNPNVVYAERNTIVNAVGHNLQDLSSHQWDMDIIQANSAWNTNIGNPSVIVAVVDSGVYPHHDFGDRLLPGYDFENNDDDPTDDFFHGTHVAGTIAATLDDGGINGVAQVNILPVKVLDEFGSGSSYAVADGIRYAASNGADIINLSLGSYSRTKVMADAVKFADNKGSLVIAAAGNDGVNLRHYPAAYSQVVGVSATDNTDQRSDYSNYGSYVELSAPGGDVNTPYRDGSGNIIWSVLEDEWILSTSLPNSNGDDGYSYSIGTSMAAPHVAGVAALILSQYPNLSNDDLRTHLQETSDDLGSSGSDDLYGHGRVNAKTAVDTTPIGYGDSSDPPPPTPTDLTAQIDFKVKTKGPNNDLTVVISLDKKVSDVDVQLHVSRPPVPGDDGNSWSPIITTNNNGEATWTLGRAISDVCYTAMIANIGEFTIESEPDDDVLIHSGTPYNPCSSFTPN
jgi:subtilisin family serine protease